MTENPDPQRTMQDYRLAANTPQYRALGSIVSRWRYAKTEDEYGMLGDVDCIADDCSWETDVAEDYVNDLLHERLAVRLPDGLLAPTSAGMWALRND